MWPLYCLFYSVIFRWKETIKVSYVPYINLKYSFHSFCVVDPDLQSVTDEQMNSAFVILATLIFMSETMISLFFLTVIILWQY